MKSIKTDRKSGNVKTGDDTDTGDHAEIATAVNETKDQKENSSQTLNAPPIAPSSTGPARLCYVDDSRTSAYVVKRMLRPFGYSVDHYESAEPALIALVQGAYDLLLTDLKVSPKGMDGDDLVRALRNSGHTKISSLPVIVITGSTDTSILADVYEAGANQIMTKPVNGDELNEHIRKLVFSHSTNFDSENNFDAPTDDEATPSSEPSTEGQNDSERSSGQLDLSDFGFSSNEEVVLETNEDEEDDGEFTGPNSLSDKPANVVFFDSEIKHNKGVEVDQPVENIDAIPVLEATEVVSSEASDDLSSDSVDIDADRRVLAQGPITDNLDQIVPKPSIKSSPAAKVKPTINAKPSIEETQALEAISKADARHVAALKARAAVKVAQKNRLIKAEKDKKKAQADAALNKLKAAAVAKATAVKRVQLIKKQKAIAAAKAKAIATAAAASAATKKKAQQDEALNADNLQLTPKDGSVFVPPTASAEAPAAVESSGTPQQSMVSTKPIELIHPRDGGSKIGAGSQSSPSSPKSVAPPPSSPPAAEKSKSPPKSTPPPGANSYSDDILRGMDQFPLVEADLPDSYAPSRFFSSFGSLFELFGFKKVIMMALGILVVFFTYDSWSTWLNIDNGIPVDLSIVEQGEIFQAITVPGKVVSKLRVNITPSIAGRLTKVLADEGDRVKKGQLLARLDDREAKSYLKKATASHNSAREDVELARRTLRRLKRAFKKGAVPRQLVEDAEVDLRSSTARESISAEEVRSAKVSLENPRILATFSGVITNRFVEVGQWVVPSESLFNLIDPKQREVEVKVDSADSSGIAVGQTVSLSSDAFPGLEWSESVTRLAAATTNVGNANTISVYISLGINSPSLRFGQQIDADIRTSWNPNAVKVPYGAIINIKGKSWIALLEGDKARLVEVATGIEDFSHVEITSGVSIGETIILANGKRLRDGDRVYLSTTR